MDENIFVSKENLKEFWLGAQPLIKQMFPRADLVYIDEAPPGEEDQEKYTLWINLSEDTPILNYLDLEEKKWIPVAGGGGGGGGTMLVPPTVTLVTVEDQATAPTSTEPIYVKFYWESEINKKTKAYIRISVNNKEVYYKLHSQFPQFNDETQQEPLEPFSFNVKDYLKVGTNYVKIEVIDIYGQPAYVSKEPKINVIELSLEIPNKHIIECEKNELGYRTSFKLKGSANLSTKIRATLTEKDGTITEIFNTEGVFSETELISLTLPYRPHGVYPITIQAETKIPNTDTKISTLPVYFEALWYEQGGKEILICSPFKDNEINKYDQYEIIDIPYYVYDPSTPIAQVDFEINGEPIRDESIPVSRIWDNWEASGDKEGTNIFTIICGDKRKDIEVDLKKVETVDVSQSLTNLIVHLKAEQKYSNNANNRDDWAPLETSADKNLRPIFKNFNWQIDGWKTVNRIPCLRVSNGSSIEVPYHFFYKSHEIKEDGKTSQINSTPNLGATLEIEFKITEVFNKDKPFFSCWRDGIGIQITPQQAILSTDGHVVSTNFSPDTGDDTIRLSFVISKLDEETNSGTILIYINGVASGATAYGSTDLFEHLGEPANIIISSVDENNKNICTVDIFNLRIYAENALSDINILNNWIYDMGYIGDQVAATKRNQVYDGEKISYKNLYQRIPCMTIIGKELPQAKGDKKEEIDIEFFYQPPGLTENYKYNFTLKGAQLDVQGTSSQYYPLKNWKFKSKYKNKNKEKVERLFNGTDEKYALGENLEPSTVFCLKIDFMESSGTHNTVTANLANAMYDNTPEGKTPPQRKDESGKIRTTIYGRPILVFYKEDELSEPRFGGKFNFNYDKDAEEIFGFTEDPEYEVIECFEFKNNTSERCRLHLSKYDDIVEAPESEWDKDYVFEENGVKKMPGWLLDFEARYQYRSKEKKDENTEMYEVPYKYLKALTDWLVSVDQTAATGNKLAEEYETEFGVVDYLYRDKDSPKGSAKPAYKLGDMITFEVDGKKRKAVDIGSLTDYTQFKFALEEFNILEDEEETDENGNKVIKEVTKTYYAIVLNENTGKESFKFNFDTSEYRLAKFKTELPEHFNLHFVLMYYLLTDILAMIDSRTKNMFWATWGERYTSDDPNKDHSDPSKDNVVIWYPIFYDMDTMMGLSNAGKRDIPYYVEYDTKLGAYTDDEIKNAIQGYYNSRDSQFYSKKTNEEFKEEDLILGETSKLYYDIDRNSYFIFVVSEVEGIPSKFKELTSSIGFAYNGADNVLWNNVEDSYKTELRTLCQNKTAGNESPLSFKKIFDAYKNHSLNWCEAIYNYDSKTKFTDPFSKGFEGFTKDSTEEKVITYPDFLYALQGDRLPHRSFWLPNRYNFISSKYSINSYLADYISMRIFTPDDKEIDELKPKADFDVTTDINQYTRIKFGSKTVAKKCEDGKTITIEAPKEKFNDTETMIYGASNLIDIGDISLKYARSIDISRAKKLRKLIAGNTHQEYTNATLDTLNTKGSAMLQELNVNGCSGLKSALDVSSSPIIETIDARRTFIPTIQLPKNGVLKNLYLPSSIKSLNIINHPNLTTLDLAKENGKYKLLDSINIENCPKINTRELVENAPQLKAVRIIGITKEHWTFENPNLLIRIKNLMGFDDSGNNITYEKSKLRGTCYVESIDDYIYEELMLHFNELRNLEELEQAKIDNKLVFNIECPPPNETVLVRFFNKYVDNNGVLQGADVPVDSGIPNNRMGKNRRLIDVPTFNIDTLNSHATRPDNWDQYFTFSGKWQMINSEGNLEDVSLGNFIITSNIDFFARYEASKKTFNTEFYIQEPGNATTEYNKTPYQTVQVKIPNTVQFPLLPNYDEENIEAKTAIRFKGWSKNKTNTVDDNILKNGYRFCPKKQEITEDILNDDEYTFKFYSVYTVDWKFPVTFYHENGTTVLKEKTTYYNGDTIVPPSTPTKEPSGNIIYIFDGWVLTDGTGAYLSDQDLKDKKVGEVGFPIGGNITYKEYGLKAKFSEAPRYRYVTYKANGEIIQEQKRTNWTGDVSYTGAELVSSYVSDNIRTISWTDDWYETTTDDDKGHTYVTRTKKWTVSEQAKLTYRSYSSGSVTSDIYKATDSGTYSVKNICDGSSTNKARLKQADATSSFLRSTTKIYCYITFRDRFRNITSLGKLNSIKLTISGETDPVKESVGNQYAGTFVEASGYNSSQSGVSYTTVASTSDSTSYSIRPINTSVYIDTNGLNFGTMSTTNTNAWTFALAGYNAYINEVYLRVYYEFGY